MADDPRLDLAILEQARNLVASLTALPKIQRCGEPWEHSRTVRGTLAALGDLIRSVERGEIVGEKGKKKVDPK